MSSLMFFFADDGKEGNDDDDDDDDNDDEENELRMSSGERPVETNKPKRKNKKTKAFPIYSPG